MGANDEPPIDPHQPGLFRDADGDLGQPTHFGPVDNPDLVGEAAASARDTLDGYGSDATIQLGEVLETERDLMSYVLRLEELYDPVKEQDENLFRLRYAMMIVAQLGLSGQRNVSDFVAQAIKKTGEVDPQHVGNSAFRAYGALHRLGVAFEFGLGEEPGKTRDDNQVDIDDFAYLYPTRFWENRDEETGYVALDMEYDLRAVAAAHNIIQNRISGSGAGESEITFVNRLAEEFFRQGVAAIHPGQKIAPDSKKGRLLRGPAFKELFPSSADDRTPPDLEVA